MSTAADIRFLVPDTSVKPDAFRTQLESWRTRMELALAARLPDSNAVPARLHQAMRYSVLVGGKRVRPALLFATARTLGLMLAMQGKQLDIAQVEEMHARKTGALIRASVLMAAACAPSLDACLCDGLATFASRIGLAFQIQDDLLDVIGDAATLGKATGADRECAKPTHPAAIGLAAAQERVHLLHAEALDSLAPFGHRAEPLRSLAGWLLSRRH